MKRLINLCDVSLRDGLQNYPKIINTQTKYHFYKNTILSGIKQIEIGSNVSSKIQQMVDIKPLIDIIYKNRYYSDYFNKDILPSHNVKVLVPTSEKHQDMLYFDYDKKVINTFSLITAATNTFTNKNMKMSVEKSLDEIDKILISKEQYKYRIYISCCFGCPFEGFSPEIITNTQEIIKKYIHHPAVSEIVISDTIGNYDKEVLKEILLPFYKNYNFNKLGLHLHILPFDIPMVLKECLALGINNYDVSFGDIGGCPSIQNKKIIKPNMNIIDTLLHTNHEYNIQKLTQTQNHFLEMIKMDE